MKVNWLLIVISLSILIIGLIGISYYFIIQAHGMTITSWFRTPWKNDEVGGIPNSFHLLGWAWDIIPVTGQNQTRLQELGLKVINEGDHLHAQLL